MILMSNEHFFRIFGTMVPNALGEYQQQKNVKKKNIFLKGPLEKFEKV